MNGTLELAVANKPKRISRDLFGIFFEDINYSADGGLYAELVQNRSFEYDATEQPSWNQLSFWERVERDSGKGRLFVSDSLPINSNNPHYAVLEIHEVGGGVGVANGGFNGISVRAGTTYDFSIFARQLYMGKPWGGDNSSEGRPMPITVRLETNDGRVLGETHLQVAGEAWLKTFATIVATGSDDAGRLVVLAQAVGAIAIDEVSLFPRDTFRGRANGLRKDLAETIAALKPQFIRFPGGCLAHGRSLKNMYRWKNTIGPVEARRQQPNLWGYHQTVGLGYFEYFQFCEDIGAKPLPVVPAGVTCQNACHTPGRGQQAIPMDEMPAYVQEVLDLVEWANGPADSPWGAKRAAAGHPEPFGLEYLGVGNEEHITPAFRERFAMIVAALKEKHPEIVVIGTSGPFHSGPDYENGWQFARELKVPVVDEHYYVPTDWFWEHLDFYDTYPRDGIQVYLGEYAAHEPDRRNTMRSALAEAAYMTSLERNGDVVRLASYAPLLAKHGFTQWRPDLIYFDNTTVSPTIGYDVQRLFASNVGDTALPVSGADDRVAVSCVRDSDSGHLILKLVTRSDEPLRLNLDLADVLAKSASATHTVLAGAPDAESASPVVDTLVIAPHCDLTLPPHSFTVLRIECAPAKK